MAILLTRSQLAIKQEAVAGTAETLAAANVVMCTEPPEWEPDIPVIERAALSASGSKRGVVVSTRMAKIRFKMFLRGTTGAPVDPTNLPDFTVPFRACAIKDTVSGTVPNEQTAFSPLTSMWSDETTGPFVTAALFRDGKRYMIHGAVGNGSITLEVGRPPLFEGELTGLYNDPTDVALLVPTYPTVVEPAFANAAVTVLGFATPKLKSIKLDFGNIIAMRAYPNGATGFFTAQITDRNPVVTLDPEEELAAAKNWWTEFTGGSSGAINTGIFPSTGTNYNQFSLAIPNAQYRRVAPGERDAIQIGTIEATCRANSDAGDNEWTFTQT